MCAENGFIFIYKCKQRCQFIYSKPFLHNFRNTQIYICITTFQRKISCCEERLKALQMINKMLQQHSVYDPCVYWCDEQPWSAETDLGRSICYFSLLTNWNLTRPQTILGIHQQSQHVLLFLSVLSCFVSICQRTNQMPKEILYFQWISDDFLSLLLKYLVPMIVLLMACNFHGGRDIDLNSSAPFCRRLMMTLFRQANVLHMKLQSKTKYVVHMDMMDTLSSSG